MKEWKLRFEVGCKFRPTEYGGMQGRFEDIDIVAVEHPLNGLCLMANHFDGRTASEFETFIPLDTDIQGITRALLHIFWQVHPEKKPAVMPWAEEQCTDHLDLSVPSPSDRDEEAEWRRSKQKEEALQRVPELIRELYRVVDEFESLFAPRPFTPDGHLVGSIGEVVAAYVYDLELLVCSSPCHDAQTKNGRLVQVKLTCGTGGVGIRRDPEQLIVLQLEDRKRFVEIYNGPGAPAWDQAGKKQNNGQRQISLSSLRRLSQNGDASWKIPQCKPFPILNAPEV